jgi:hypothetical protein
MNKTLLAAVAFSLFLIPEAKATDYPSNWSLDLKGGITSGFFTFDSKTTAQAGFQVRYSMNPVVAFYGDLGVGQFRSSDDLANEFSNDYLAVGVGARLNLLRMLTGLNSVTENLGLYASTGVGLMRGDVSVSNTNVPGHIARNAPVNAFLYRITTGATYRVSQRVDLFVQAEFNHSNSDFLDGYRRANGASSGRISGGDSFLNTSAGITFKFGRKQTPHVDWQPWDHRADPLARSLRQDIDRLEAELEKQEKSHTQLAQRMQSLNQTINEFSYLINTAHKQEFKNYDAQLQSLQNRMDLVQSDVNDITEQMHVQRTDPVENRFFVVAAVFRNRENAERQLQQVRNEGFGQASIQQDRRRSNYLVCYSGHTTREAALEEMRRVRADVNPESWVYVK